ncbi:MAG: xanthine permease [Clostridiales bacterium GWF2_38_85]|nr:MAG: xanthine permease [Clostridiales bacterium GWF2_38_85]HBL85294.1 xanthine permease [Clostridiales bacterium]
MKEPQVIGYLPDERPPIWKLFLYALQQVVVMFPATILVALITGFHVSTTIFASGLATICFILITGKKIPLYYGSSFSYLSAIASIMVTQRAFGEVAPDAEIAIAQFGIIMSGLVSIVAGLIIKLIGKKAIDFVLPATVTGPIAMIIGLSLAGNALKDASGYAKVEDVVTVNNYFWIVALITLFATILFSVYLKGVLGQLPLLFGPLVGCLAAYIIGLNTGTNLFRELSATAGQGIFALPHFTLPIPSWAAVLAIMPIAIATIPESTAHVYQLDIYVNDLAKKKNTGKKYNIAEKLWINLVGDGVGDMVSAAIGGPAGTNYGENISAMAITKVFSIWVLGLAAILAMIIACFTPLINALYAIPQAVIGGLEVFLFGAIAAQGIAIMIDKKVDMFNPKNIAVIATIMVIGVGGQYVFDGNIPFYIQMANEVKQINIPCIAGAAVFGIVLNLILSIGKKEKVVEVDAQ